MKKPRAISYIEPNGIVACGGAVAPIDTLVLATGFNLWDVNFPAIEILGRGGLDLGKWWRGTRFQAFEGVAVPEFPNYLTLGQPVRLHRHRIPDAPHQMPLHRDPPPRGHHLRSHPEANRAFLRRVTAKLGDSVFYAGNCTIARSYYFNQHGEAALLRPTSSLTALREATRFPLDAYSYA